MQEFDPNAPEMAEPAVPAPAPVAPPVDPFATQAAPGVAPVVQSVPVDANALNEQTAQQLAQQKLQELGLGGSTSASAGASTSFSGPTQTFNEMPDVPAIQNARGEYRQGFNQALQQRRHGTEERRQSLEDTAKIQADKAAALQPIYDEAARDTDKTLEAAELVKQHIDSNMATYREVTSKLAKQMQQHAEEYANSNPFSRADTLTQVMGVMGLAFSFRNKTDPLNVINNLISQDTLREQAFQNNIKSQLALADSQFLKSSMTEANASKTFYAMRNIVKTQDVANRTKALANTFAAGEAKANALDLAGRLDEAAAVQEANLFNQRYQNEVNAVKTKLMAYQAETGRMSAEASANKTTQVKADPTERFTTPYTTMPFANAGEHKEARAILAGGENTLQDLETIRKIFRAAKTGSLKDLIAKDARVAALQSGWARGELHAGANLQGREQKDMNALLLPISKLFAGELINYDADEQINDLEQLVGQRVVTNIRAYRDGMDFKPDSIFAPYAQKIDNSRARAPGDKDAIQQVLDSQMPTDQKRNKLRLLRDQGNEKAGEALGNLR